MVVLTIVKVLYLSASIYAYTNNRNIVVQTSKYPINVHLPKPKVQLCTHTGLFVGALAENVF